MMKPKPNPVKLTARANLQDEQGTNSSVKCMVSLFFSEEGKVPKESEEKLERQAKRKATLDDLYTGIYQLP